MIRFITDAQAEKVKNLLPQYQFSDTNTDKYLGYIRNLPSPNTGGFITNIILLLMEAAGVLMFIGIVVAGVMLVASRENEQLRERAKKIIISLIIGMVVVAAAYAITYGVSQIDFSIQQ